MIQFMTHAYQYVFVIPNSCIKSANKTMFERNILNDFGIRVKFFENIPIADTVTKSNKSKCKPKTSKCYDTFLLVHYDDYDRAMEIARQTSILHKFEMFLVAGHRNRYSPGIIQKYWRMNPDFLTWIKHYPPDMNLMPVLQTMLNTIKTEFGTPAFFQEIRRINASRAGGFANAA